MNADDPKFTAHALGELEDLTPAERAEIEALLADDPNAAAEAAETQALAARLRAELPGEAAAALGAEQRAAVFKAAASAVPEGRIVRFPRRTMVLSVIAACAVVGISIGLIVQMLQVPGPSPQLAVNTTETPASPTVSVEPLDAPLPTPPSAELASASPPPPAVPAGDVNLAGTGNGPLPLNATSSTLPRLQLAQVLATPSPAVKQTETMAYLNGTLIASNGAQSVPHFSTATMSPARPAEPSRPLVAAPARAQKAIMLAQADSAPSPDAYANTAEHPQGDPKLLDNFRLRSSIKRWNGPPRPSETDSVSTRSFEGLPENAFLPTRENPLSTFSIDVDTASYAIVRRMLNDNQRPPSGAVRIEELLNYFPYDYPQPKGDVPFSATMEVAACPWAPEHRLVRIGLKGREIPKDQRPPSNLVFLIDVSGSMNMPNKLPLLKESLGLLIDQLREQDQVSIVVYAGNSGCVLDPTHDKAAMREAISRLEAGGSTNGASGIQLAYQIAEKALIKGGTNRVILATDGDWNVGITNRDSLLEMIARKAKSGVFLTVLGFGMDNLQDAMLVKLADRGNGNYAYIDTLLEARKVFVEQLSSTLVTIAKGVKIQVEFNPAQVGAYRLIGYEKRLLAKEDFNNDKKDAGEIGAGHTVTALYEIVPAGQEISPMVMVDKLKYQSLPSASPESSKELPATPATTAPAPVTSKAEGAPRPEKKVGTADPSGTPAAAVGGEMLTLKLRYKAPDGDKSKLLEFPLTDPGTPWEKSSPDFHFAAAVAGYGMMMRDSTYQGETTWQSVTDWAHAGLGADASGYRTEFLGLLEKAKALVP